MNKEKYRFVIFRYRDGKSEEDEDYWDPYPRRQMYQLVYQSKKWYHKRVDCVYDLKWFVLSKKNKVLWETLKAVDENKTPKVDGKHLTNKELTNNLWALPHIDKLVSTKYIFSIRARKPYKTKKGGTRYKYSYLRDSKQAPWDAFTFHVFGNMDEEDSIALWPRWTMDSDEKKAS